MRRTHDFPLVVSCETLSLRNLPATDFAFPTNAPYNRFMSDSLHPRRIACLQPSATVILASIGELHRVVACTKYCADVVPELRSELRSELRGVDRLIIADSWTSKAS